MTNSFLVSKFLAPWEGGNIVGQQLPALLDVICCVLSRSRLSKREHCPQRKDSKHMFVSHCHVFMSIKENPEAEAHVRLHTLLHVVACCCVLLGIVAQSLNPVKRLSQQLLNFFLFPDRRGLAQQCCRLHCSFNTLGATHAHYTCSPKHYGLYPPHDALHVPTLLGVVAPVCTSLPTRRQQLPSLLAHQCWELFGPFASRFTRSRWRCFQS